MLAAGCIGGFVFMPGTSVCAQEAPQGSPPPTFRELEARGARIGEVRVDTQNIFDPRDPHENYGLFQLANTLHIRTRPHAIERLLLFKPGEPVSERLIEETERLLRTYRFLYDVSIKPAGYRDGVVDIDVTTRDTWSLDLTGRLGRSGGTNSFGFGILEYNLLGTGTTLGYSESSDVDRHGREFQASYGQAFDGRTILAYSQGRFSDGDRTMASITRPFYALDTRWAAGASWDKWNRIDAIYNAGDVASEYRHVGKATEVFGGWSPGLVSGWTQRFSAGVTALDDTYRVEPDRIAPDALPIDHTVRGPFLRHELVEDHYVRVSNRDLIARPEFFEMGFRSRLQVTRSLEAWGASRSAWLYSLSLSRGFSMPWGHDLLASATAQRQVGSTGALLDQAGAMFRYYGPQSARSAFYAAISADALGNGAAAPDQLLLGGDNGLRGYPLRYQSGDRRALLTVEHRLYTDWYPFRLVRVGGAVFFDVGRAWGGVNQNAENPGWLSDVGFGLRLALDRAAFGNVLHADVAVPLDRAPGIKSVQFLVKTQVKF